MNLIKEMQEKDKGKDEKLDLLENELFSLKFRMAELINATMELGDIELVDKIEEIVTAGSPKQKKKETNKKKSVLS